MPLALSRNEAGGRKRCPIFRGIADYSAGTSHPRFHSVPQEPVSCTEYLFRTGKACFLHRMPQKMRRVPQEPVLRTARIFRTIGGRFRYRAPLNNKNPESFYSTFGVHVTLVTLLEEAGGVGNGHRSRVHSQSYYLEEAGLSGGN